MPADDYCAFCSGPLHSLVSIARPRTSSTEQSRLETLALKFLGGNGEDVSDKASEDDEGSNEARSSCQEQERNGSDNCSCDQDRGYDHRLVTENEVQWLNDTACLGFNPDAPLSVEKAWQGWGLLYDNGHYSLIDGGDGRSPYNPRAYCYRTFNVNSMPVFPYHEDCKVILGQVLGKDLLRPIQETDEEDTYGSDLESEISRDESDSGHSKSPADEFKAWWDRMGRDFARVDKDALYHALSQLNTTGKNILDIDYGVINGAGLFWRSIPGEEYVVHSPRLQSLPVSDLTCNFVGSPSASRLNFYHKVRRDPFSKVPEDILFMISDHLPGDAVKAFMQASLFYNRATCDNRFWRRRFKEDILIWCWELRPVFEKLPADTTDFRRLYRWIDYVTTPRLGLRTVLPIANRRRIWGACEKVKELYAKEFNRKMREDDKEGLVRMESLQMPATAYPTPPGSSGVWTHWAEGFATGPGIFETFWNRDGALVGIALAMRSRRKLLGRDESEDLGIVKKCAPIPAGESITGFLLHINKIHLSLSRAIDVANELRENMEYNRWQREKCGHTPEKWPELDKEWSTLRQQIQELEKELDAHKAGKASIRALTVNLNSGTSVELGTMPTGSLNKRTLFIPQSAALLGLSATTAVVSAADLQRGIFTEEDKGVITRLAVIHSPGGVENYALFPEAQRTLWHPQVTAAPAPKSKDGTNTCPIWAHPNLIMTLGHIRRAENLDSEAPVAFLPHEALVWAKDVTELTYIRRISALRQTRCRKLATGERLAVVREIVGFRVEYREEFNVPARIIGRTSSNPQTGFCEDELVTVGDPQWSHFDIDGANGEAILEVFFDDVEGTGDVRVLVQTTWNRICVWSTHDDQDGSNSLDQIEYPIYFEAGGLAAAFYPEGGALVAGTTLILDGD